MSMIISLIVAMGKNRQIGINNTLPWKLPSDLKLFKELTTNHHVLMGRKTFESIGRPLPNRIMLVLSKRQDLLIPDGHIVSSIEQAIDFSAKNGEDELFIIGGANIYEQTLSIVDRIYLSTVDYDGPADTFFPLVNLDSWRVIKDSGLIKSEKDSHSFSQKIFEKK